MKLIRLFFFVIIGCLIFTLCTKEEVETIFSSNINTITFIADGENKTIELTSSVAWNASSSEDWLKVNPSTGKGDKVLTLTADRNEETRRRTALLTLVATTNETIKIQVSQSAQPESPPIGAVSFEVKLDNDDWVYELGEEVYIEVSLSRNIGVEYSVSYEIGLEKMLPAKKETFNTKDQSFVINAGTLDAPGFLRCIVSVEVGDQELSSVVTAAFEPDKIIPTINYPVDFNTFWSRTIAEARKIPLATKMTLLEDKSTSAYNVFHVSFQNGSIIDKSYAIVTIPKKSGKYPAIIRYPGAGVYPSGANSYIADKNVISLNYYIHPYPMLEENSFYDIVDSNYKYSGVESRDTYYFKRVITGSVKAVDLIYSLDQFDGKNVALWGSSQGGALSIITASLDKRVRSLVALSPAMCDHTGYLNDRAGGWPHFLYGSNKIKFNKSNVLETLAYYDVVNFANNLTVPGYYSWGFNDETTPPTSMYSAYNVITSPKHLYVIKDGVHTIYTEQTIKSYEWLFDSFSN